MIIIINEYPEAGLTVFPCNISIVDTNYNKNFTTYCYYYTVTSGATYVGFVIIIQNHRCLLKLLTDSTSSRNIFHSLTALITKGIWLFRPFAVSPPRRFAPWLVRLLACSPPRTLDDSPNNNELTSNITGLSHLFQPFTHGNDNFAKI